MSKLMNFKLSNFDKGHVFGFSEAVAEAIPVGVDQMLCHVKIASAMPKVGMQWRFCVQHGKCIDKSRKGHNTIPECVSGPQ
jgi:hypothetical protein